METDFNLKRHKFYCSSSYWLIFILYLLGRASVALYLMAGDVGGWNSLTSSSAFCILFFFALGTNSVVVMGGRQCVEVQCWSYHLYCFKACTAQSSICKWTKETVQDFLISTFSCPSSWSLEIYSFYLEILQLKMFSRELHICILVILLTGFKAFFWGVNM